MSLKGRNMRPLTPIQNDIFVYLKSYIMEKGYSPSSQDVGDHFKMSRKGAYCHLRALCKKGYISMSPGVARSIVIEKNS